MFGFNKIPRKKLVRYYFCENKSSGQCAVVRKGDDASKLMYGARDEKKKTIFYHEKPKLCYSG